MADETASDAPKTSPTGGSSAAAPARGSGGAPASGAAPPAPVDPRRLELDAIAADLRGVAPTSSDPTECLAIAANVAGGAYESGQGDLARDLDGIGCPEPDRKAICRRVGVPVEPRPRPPPDPPSPAAAE